MKRTMVFWSVGLALTLMGGQGFAASTTLNEEGTNVKNFDDINVSISSPNSGFYIKEAAKTAMFSLLAAVGSKDGSMVNTINVGGENTETVFLDGTAQFGTTSNGIEWVSTTAVYAADQNATVNIQAKDSVTIVSNDIGILGQSNTQHGLSDDDDPKRPVESAQINIRSANISIIADNQAVMAFSNSGIELSASDTIYLEGAHAIDTRGNSVINVNTDVDALQESVQSFLDAVNSLLVTIQTFTAYDENAETTSTDPEDDNYSMSQLTSQKGGILQGIGALTS